MLYLSQLSSYVNTGIPSFFQISPLQPSQQERESANVSMIHSDGLASRQQNFVFPSNLLVEDVMVSEVALISKTSGSKEDSKVQKRSFRRAQPQDAIDCFLVLGLVLVTRYFSPKSCRASLL